MGIESLRNVSTGRNAQRSYRGVNFAKEFGLKSLRNLHHNAEPNPTLLSENSQPKIRTKGEESMRKKACTV